MKNEEQQMAHNRLNRLTQETLEQAAEKYAHNYFNMHETNNYIALKQGYEAGAKEMAERMYSEKEVYSILEQAMKDCYRYELEEHYSGDYRNLKEWFETFKKK
jgi:hypothetical protein